jgi:hypothetical protein
MPRSSSIFSATAGTANPIRRLRMLWQPCVGRFGAKRIYSYASTSIKRQNLTRTLAVHGLRTLSCRVVGQT